MEIDKKIIKKLVDALEDLKKSLKDSNEEINTQETVEEEIDSSKVIKSPIIGTAYLAPEPGAKQFVEIAPRVHRLTPTPNLLTHQRPLRQKAEPRKR